jgi:hypothetical protein
MKRGRVVNSMSRRAVESKRTAKNRRASGGRVTAAGLTA